MKIEFTKDEFRTLLDVVYLGNWMINACRLHDQRVVEVDKITEKVFSLAEAFGLKELAELDFQGSYAESEKFEDELEDKSYLNDYDETTFWEELMSTLSKNYLMAQYEEPLLRALSQEEFFMKRAAMEMQVASVLERGGVKNLVLKDFTPDPV